MIGEVVTGKIKTKHDAAKPWDLQAACDEGGAGKCGEGE